MCGGEGRRLDADGEKPLFEIDGTPMVDAVCDALAESRIDATHAAVSPATPATRDHLSTRPSVHVHETAGDGYVADLEDALEAVETPVLTVAADLPLLSGEAVDAVLDRFAATRGTDSLTVCVPAALMEALGVSVDTTVAGEERPLAPTGINVVASGDGDATTVTWDARLAVNVNRPVDAEVAEVLA